jgi:putative flippase GtrA
MTTRAIKLYQYCCKNWSLLARYAISGGAGVVANLIVFGLIVEYYALSYIFGAVIGFVAAYLVTFSMHKWWTFTATAATRTVAQGTLYLTSALLGLGFTIIALKVMIDGLGLWPLLAQFIALGMVAVLSFIFTAQITFHADQSRLSVILLILKRVTEVLATEHRFWLSLLALLLVVTASVRLSTMPLFITSDTEGYAATADLLLGVEAEVNGARYLKPLAPAVVAVLSVFGLDTVSGVLVQSVLFYFILGFAVYWFGFLLFKNRAAGFIMATLIVTSFPIVKYGLDYLTETGAWTWYFLSLALMVLWYRTTATKWLWLLSVTLLCGVLWKEYAVLAGLTFFFLVCFHPALTLRAKLHALVQSGALVLIPWLMWQYHVYVTYQYSYLDWMSIGAAPEAYATMYTVPAVVKSLFVLLGIGWLLVAIGVWRYRSLQSEIQFFIKIMFIPAFGFLLWGYVSSRLFFALVPLAVIFAVAGVLGTPRTRTRVAMVVLSAVVSIGLVWISFVPDIRALLDTITYGT